MSELRWVRRGKGAEGLKPPPPVKMPDLIWQVLYSRGLYKSEQLNDIFSPKLSSLADPWVLRGMDLAVERLLQAYHRGEKICIYADFDLDGTSGLALLFAAMQDLGFKELVYYQPKRLSEGYGVHPQAVEVIAQDAVKVMVTIDVGITDILAAEKAKELGIDLIVTDHHQPKEVLPSTYTTINPNCEECDSGLGYLSGAGVAFFLLLALRRALAEQGLLPEGFDPKKYLDCFAIGTLTDMVPVVKENRVLCKHGLLQLARTERPGLKHLLQELGLWGKSLSSQDVGFRFAPKLNALSRMETSVMPIDIYMEKDEKKARELVTQVMGCNEMRRTLQKEAEAKALHIYKENPTEGYVFVYSETFHKGVVGLVATRLAQSLGVPSFVGFIDEEGALVGSARAAARDGQSLLEAFEFSKSCLKRFGGHKAAAGFEMRLDQAEKFHNSLAKFYSEQEVEDFQPLVEYDASGKLPEVTPQFMKWYEQLGPFGTDFDPPVFRFNDVEVVSCRELRGGHLKLLVQQAGTFKTHEALWFSPPEGSLGIHPGQRVDLLAEPAWNEFAGRRTLQILVKDLREHQ